MNRTMKAAVLYGKHDLRFEPYDVPAIGPRDVMVRVTANGICGSDIHFFEDGRLGPFVVQKPYIPGHEAVGVIEHKGSGVPESWAMGTKVIIEPGIPCGVCSFCRIGRYNLCQSVRFLSAPPENGTFADFVAVPYHAIHLVPRDFPDELGALVEPASVAAHALQRLHISAGSTLTILGAGLIGLITLLMARAYGVASIVIADITQYRLRKAKELGASLVVDNSDPQEAIKAMMDYTRGLGTQFVIDTTGSSTACASAPRWVSRGGRIALVGWPETSSLSFPIEMVIEKEIDVVGINRYCNVFPGVISMMKERLLDVTPVITHRFKFKDVTEAFSFAAKNRGESLKILVEHI